MSKTGIVLMLCLALGGCDAEVAPSRPSPAETPVARAIHDELSTRTRIPRRTPAGAMDRALVQLYAGRDFRPLWNDPPALHALMETGFAALEQDGLRPQDYVVRNWAARAARVYADGVEAREGAAFDLEISRRYLRALSHVAYGKVDPASIGTRWETAPTAVAQRLSLAWAGLAAQVGASADAFAQARPPQAAYRHLRAALAAPGIDAHRRAQLRVNLERARWLSRDLPEHYVLVDIADYRLQYRRPNGELWQSKVVVGKPYRETPTFRSEIDTLTVNPAWTVPPTIFERDIAPKARRDAAAILQARHLRAVDPQGREVPLSSIDWDDPRSVILRQDPGPENPLGRVKFSFDNPYQVYLHDTAHPERFDLDDRANSSGCIRVQHAVQLAQLLLQDSGTVADLPGMIAANRTQDIALRHPVPVLLHYSTVDVTPDGEVRLREDLYGRDPALLQALDRE